MVFKIFPMMKIPSFLTLAGLFLSAATSVVSADSQLIETFHLQDRIHFPAYAWPRTSLSYRVDFANKPVDPARLHLKDASGMDVPFQLTQVKKNGDRLTSATIQFFSDLPSGGERTFRLVESDGAAAQVEHPVRSTTTAEGIEVAGGKISVRLPLSQTFSPGTTVPGPIMALNRGQGWIGRSELVSPNRRILSVKTEPVTTGDLEQTWRVFYEFQDGGKYTATVKVVSDYEFIEFFELIEGIAESDGVKNEMHWTGFAPNRRFGTESSIFDLPNNQKWPAIDWNAKTAYLQEDPRWDPGILEDVSKEMWMKLSPSSGNGVRELHSSCSFWNDQPGGDELGVFILEAKHWQDHNYGIWQPTQAFLVTFRYRDGLLTWTWPVMNGSRSTAINYHPVEVGEMATSAMESIYKGIERKISSRVDWTSACRFRYNRLLQQQYGPLSLDKVKDWVLTYPETAKRPPCLFDQGSVKTADELVEKLFRSGFVFYPLGQGGPPGVDSIGHRFFYDWGVDGLMRLGDALTPEQRERVDALLLFAGYVLSGDDMNPIRNCLDGTPNMSADGWAQVMIIAALYPEHPMSKEWREYFAKQWDVNGVFYTRPEVPAWDARGGRWTESLSVYHWAYISPTAKAHEMGFLCDGVNRWATPETALRGRWLIDMLTAPVVDPNRHSVETADKNKSLLSKLASAETSPSRAYPAHGAHGSGTTVEVTSVVNELGYFLRNYDPLTAEHLMWAKSSEKLFDSNPNKAPFYRLLLDRYAMNAGTPPDLESCKYTGHGVVLRSGVDSPDEVSLHLQQVDAGPNYRWGWGGNGASGSLYLYGGGKVWAGHEREDAGDHDLNAGDGVTSFSVMKDDAYRSIGYNELERPLVNLGFAQFAEITSKPESDAWPEYESRSIFMVGTDYFLIYDKMGVVGRRSGRFSWFVSKKGEFPDIVFLKPLRARADHYREVLTATAKGFQRDAGGSHLTFVTPKRGEVKLGGVKAKELPFLSFAPLKEYTKDPKLPKKVWQVETPTSNDTFWRDEDVVEYSSPAESFSGNTGVIRRLKSGGLQLAIAGSGYITTEGLTIRVKTVDTGISLTREAAVLSGICYSPGNGVVEFDFGSLPGTLYLDGEPVPSKSLTLAKGHHHWEYATGPCQPMRPSIERTENSSQGAKVYFQPAAGASSYQIQATADNGASWKTLAEGQQSPIQMDHLANGTKYRVRLVALNGQRTSKVSPEYPLYINGEPPAYPDGLQLKLGVDKIRLTWGEVLGVSEYRLYRRTLGETDWKMIRQGLERSFSDDSAKGAVPHCDLPGQLDNEPYEGIIYEYAVSAVNGNGEGSKSPALTSDPTSWLNWWPDAPRQFKRQSEYTKPPYVKPHKVPPPFYPASEKAE